MSNFILKVINESKTKIIDLLETEKYIGFIDRIPVFTEVYSRFSFLAEKNNVDMVLLPELPLDIFSISEGIFKRNNLLISVTNIEAGLLKYVALNALESHQRSKHIDAFRGKYLTILKKVESVEIYEPFGFSYFIREELFLEKDTKYIFPMLILPHTIPEHVLNEWVFFAMKEFNALYKDVDYMYLIRDKSEYEKLSPYI